MTLMRTFVTFLLAAAVTAAALLSLARLPGGETVSALLNRSAQLYLHEPFDQTLVRELAAVEDPALRQLMHHLVILHITEHARQAGISALSEDANLSFRQNPGDAARRDPFDPALSASLTNSPTHSMTTGSIGVAEPEAPINHWAMMLCFLLGIVWMSIRRA